MAAGQGTSSQSRQIISRLVGRIGELSQGLDAEQSSFKPTSEIEPTELTEAEIRRVLGRSCNSESNTCTSTTASFLIQPRPTPTSPQSQPRLYSMRKNFTNQRTNVHWRSGESRKGKGPKKNKVVSEPFSQDIILLGGLNVEKVPRQASKVFLQENAHIISAFEFQKEWNEIDVEIEIRNAFKETLSSVWTSRLCMLFT